MEEKENEPQDILGQLEDEAEKVERLKPERKRKRRVLAGVGSGNLSELARTILLSPDLNDTQKIGMLRAYDGI